MSGYYHYYTPRENQPAVASDKLLENLGSPVEFLYYLYILSNAGGKILPPPVRLIVSGAEAGAWFGQTLGEYSAELGAQGIYNPVTELYTPAIMAYEQSALGSTRII